MSLRDCKAPVGVARRFRWTRRIDHGSVPLRDRAVGLMGKYGAKAEGSMGDVGARGPAAGSEDIAGGKAQGFILYLIKAGFLPVRFRPRIAGAVGRHPALGPERATHSSKAGALKASCRQRRSPKRSHRAMRSNLG
jgi:hypothetical protein